MMKHFHPVHPHNAKPQKKSKRVPENARTLAVGLLFVPQKHSTSFFASSSFSGLQRSFKQQFVI
jgi:hypothetical protein